MAGPEALGSQFAHTTAPRPDSDVRVIPATPIEDLFINAFQLAVDGNPPMMTWGCEYRGVKERCYVQPPEGRIVRSVSSPLEVGSRIFHLEGGTSITVLPTTVKGKDIDVLEAEIEKGRKEKERRISTEAAWVSLERGTEAEFAEGAGVAAVPVDWTE